MSAEGRLRPGMPRASAVRTRGGAPWRPGRSAWPVRRRGRYGFLLAVLATLASSCANFGSVDGVANLWREVPVDSFERGVTTQASVLEQLGPPSQLIRLEHGTAFYYLTEETTGKGVILLVWNRIQAQSRYDRAIFFFDEGGVLEEFSYSREQVAR